MEDYSCPNCNSNANGNYCAQCGQKKIEGKENTWTLLKTFGGQAFNYDSKFWKTLSLLLSSPGQLTIDYRKGKRQRYILPNTLYLYISIAYFLLKALAPGGDAKDFKINIDPKAAVIAADSHNQSFDAYFNRKMIETNKSPEAFKQRINSILPKIFFFMIPAMAFLLKLCFIRNSEYQYIDHVIYALHMQGFAFIMLIPLSLLANIGILKVPLACITAVIVTAYFLLSLKKVYQTSWVKTMGIWLFVATCYTLVAFVSIILALIWIIGFW